MNNHYREIMESVKNPAVAGIAIFLGLFVDLVVFMWITSYDFIYDVQTSSILWWLYTVYIPVLIGSFIAGLIARHYGWIVGCVNAFFFTAAFEMDLLHFWQNPWLRIALGLFTGVLGGFLGDNLMHVWHKRRTRGC